MFDVKPGFAALVVDDDEFSRRTAVRVLHRLGAGSVMEAGDGEQALRCARTAAGRLDLVVCDLRMPQLDGIETLRYLATDNASTLFVFASSADARVLRSARDMASTFGIRSLRTLEKPVTPLKLQAIFDEVEACAVEACAAIDVVPAREASRLVSADDLLRGVRAGELAAYYQPKVTMSDREVAGAEALVRWHHPVHGLLSPHAFLSVANASGLMEQLTDLMFAAAVARCAQWRLAGLDISVSVNLPIECLGSRDLPRRLEAVTIAHRLLPEHMILEVPEDGWLRDEAVAREVLTRLRVHGFNLSIDDFGTGYSTTQQLLQAPFNEMKIDQSFVIAAPGDEESAVVLSSSIALAHRLGLTVVGEGAETQAHWDILRQAGCDQVQGYFVARPMPGDDFLAWSRSWKAQLVTVLG